MIGEESGDPGGRREGFECMERERVRREVEMEERQRRLARLSKGGIRRREDSKRGRRWDYGLRAEFKSESHGYISGI